MDKATAAEWMARYNNQGIVMAYMIPFDGQETFSKKDFSFWDRVQLLFTRTEVYNYIDEWTRIYYKNFKGKIVIVRADRYR